MELTINREARALMQISAIGNRPRCSHPAAGYGLYGQCCQSGFTLLEILLVLIIIVVASALIIPSFFSAKTPSPDLAARELVKVLRLAADEAALDGRPLLWYATKNAYGFDHLDKKGKWQAYTTQPFAKQRFPNGITLRRVTPEDALFTIKKRKGYSKADPVIARLLLLPTGIEMSAQIVLGVEHHPENEIVVKVQPGPGGIQFADHHP